MDEQPVIRWRVVLYAILITAVMLNALPFIGGLYYMTTGSHPAEQDVAGRRDRAFEGLEDPDQRP